MFAFGPQTSLSKKTRWKAKRKPEDDPQVELDVLKIQRSQAVLSNGEGLSAIWASLNFWLHVENLCGPGHTKKIKGYAALLSALYVAAAESSAAQLSNNNVLFSVPRYDTVST